MWKICGSLQTPNCEGKVCPPGLKFEVPGGSFSIQFFSDYYAGGADGFSLSWSVITRRTGLPGRFPTAVNYFSVGAASFVSSDVTAISCKFQQNAVSDTFLALGAGISVSDGNVLVENTIFLKNSVSAILCGGGALAVLGDSFLRVYGCNFWSNSATAAAFWLFIQMIFY